MLKTFDNNPSRKIGRNLFYSNKNDAGCIQDQCCHHLSDGTIPLEIFNTGPAHLLPIHARQIMAPLSSNVDTG
jgi:hypothetical protein